jgi:small subunit ribosomal protein S2
VIAVLDTNCDPDEVDFPIPGNDDAIRSAELLTKVIAAAVADGLIKRSGRNRGDADDKPEPGTVAAGEPLPEWERDLYEGAEKKADDAAPAPAAAEQPEAVAVAAAPAAE